MNLFRICGTVAKFLGISLNSGDFFRISRKLSEFLETFLNSLALPRPLRISVNCSERPEFWISWKFQGILQNTWEFLWISENFSEFQGSFRNFWKHFQISRHCCDSYKYLRTAPNFCEMLQTAVIRGFSPNKGEFSKFQEASLNLIKLLWISGKVLWIFGKISEYLGTFENLKAIPWIDRSHQNFWKDLRFSVRFWVSGTLELSDNFG